MSEVPAAPRERDTMASTKMLLLLLSVALLALSSARDVNDGKKGKEGIVQGMAGLKFME